MKVLVDTCVWSQVLRHKNPKQDLEQRLKDLIHDGRVAIIGPIRQELLSGISDATQFLALQEQLVFFEDTPLESKHFIKAAEFCNTCRKKGIQGSTTDFLICVVAHLEQMLVFTTDLDFISYQKYLPFQLFEKPKE